MSSEPFLSRWSRRKRAVAAEPLPDAPGPPEVEAATPAVDAAPSPTQEPGDAAVLSEAELSPGQIAALPSVEDLTAETDISVFLRKGVPEPLRRAALRRMWVLDPKIRDFVCEAREYAYDWNTPGGVPGNGTLPASDEIARMAARIVGGERPASTAAEGDAGNCPQDPEQAALLYPVSHAPGDAPPPALAVTRDEAPSRDQRDGANLVVSAPAEKLSASKPTDTDADVLRAPRRHGGAMPL